MGLLLIFDLSNEPILTAMENLFYKKRVWFDDWHLKVLLCYYDFVAKSNRTFILWNEGLKDELSKTFYTHFYIIF